jgi:predicted dehydrogenase
MERKIRWGILGAANIACKNWKAIWNSGNSTVAVVASRDLARAKQFISDCQRQAPMENPPTALNSYEAVLQDSSVDAVYIPLPTGVRKQWVLRAAEAGKHVLCEKPCACSVEDLREMIEACRARKVQFMDGVMFMHSARLPKMREALDRQLGEIKRITSAFSFRGSAEFFAKDIRTQSGLEPFGCLGDLGWYCIRFALWAMNERLPRRVTGRSLSQSEAAPGFEPVPTELSGELFFDGGVSAGFYCSFLTETEQWAQVSGSKGLLRLGDFVLPFFGDEVEFEVSNPFFEVKGCDFNMEPRSRKTIVSEYSNSHPTSQETKLFRDFSALVLSGRIDNSWPEIALKTQQVMQACFESARNGGSAVEIPQ